MGDPLRIMRGSEFPGLLRSIGASAALEPNMKVVDGEFLSNFHVGVEVPRGPSQREKNLKVEGNNAGVLMGCVRAFLRQRRRRLGELGEERLGGFCRELG